MYIFYANILGMWRSHIRKILFIMRLTTVLILITMMHVSASTSAQKITYVQKDATLVQLFKEIKKQAGYNVVWNDDKFDATRSINANFKNTDLKEVMEKGLNGLPFTYSMTKKTIVIKEKPSSLLDRILDHFADIDVRGIVHDDQGLPLAGVTVTVKGNNRSTKTNESGEFSVENVDEKASLIISYLGFESQEINVTQDIGIVRLKLFSQGLNEIEVVSTGYQNLSKVNATGSFVKIDSNLLNRSVSSDILARLDGIVNGLYVDKRLSGRSIMNVRGINTLGGSAIGALIIVDNFPYEGDLANINPNDVESISILKDAAAASIWGARAGNGVIVITLKKGKFNSDLRVTVNSSLNLVEKPNLFYHPQMSSSDFIDVEQFLYQNNFYQNDLTVGNSSRPVISPVVDLLDKQSKGLISATEATNQINALRNIDYRNDVNNHFNQKAIHQQYSLNLNGGSKVNSYLISAGYDHNRGTLVGNANSRYSIRASNNLRLIKKLELRTSFSLAQVNSESNGLSNIKTRKGIYPYMQLWDANTGALAIPETYNKNYTDTAGAGRLLDWSYRPLEEIGINDNTLNVQDINFNASLKYQILDGLDAELLYRYERQISTGRKYNSPESYFTRNLINQFTQITGAGTKRIIPMGGILDRSFSNLKANNLRGQINYNKILDSKHQLNILLGSELSQSQVLSNTDRIYGYNDEILSYANVDFVNQYPVYDNLLTDNNGYIPNNVSFSGALNRMVSLYSNAAYTFNKRYTLSGSARRDAANVFGVNTNQKWKPLWSMGASWDISAEKFYAIGWLPSLRARATYGFSGNVSPGVITKPVIYYVNGPAQFTNYKYALVNTPPNPDARWEELRMINYGLDFAFKGNFLTGSLEYFTKKTDDLFASTPIDATTGFNIATKNVAQTRGRGFELTLNSNNIDLQLKWTTSASIAYVKDIVSRFFNKPLSASSYVGNAISIAPLENYPLYPMFSYKFYGLDPQTGDPIGIFKGENSKSYSSLTTDSLKNLTFHGSAIPLYTGFLRNTFSWKGIELSFNITYKLDYYIRRQAINYSSLFNNWRGDDDYSRRWQKPADELNTTVPSMVFPANTQRDSFYAGSEVNVDRGDHIRLNDIILRYNLSPAASNKIFKNLQFSLTASNIGIIWKETNQKLDPDYPYSMTGLQKGLAFGFKANL
ncbi:SusC/RagA family TonB-linked outer membrane protein [Pedobacter psychroterrae]|uniref:SusC/RagA family TonB-linked outer membrane protein n=1 Tax=Pedobacter psychroterrae TaxID=2530453 RepID=A0A4R0NP34_9SPHI|nr:SusC/RagA family TonB-linked outer membrane protein [Pedobacter psychroterrae]TCD02730.1 SusC/RagA family TonB-linked outer membrane protein [Pedobacter psychroterrae]